MSSNLKIPRVSRKAVMFLQLRKLWGELHPNSYAKDYWSAVQYS